VPNGLQLCVRVAGVVQPPSIAAARRSIMSSSVRSTGNTSEHPYRGSESCGSPERESSKQSLL
jgi:hypothetical protein